MHNLNHTEFAKATADARVPAGRRHRPTPPEPPPTGRLRALAAQRLAVLAGRLDREAARRAVA